MLLLEPGFKMGDLLFELVFALLEKGEFVLDASEEVGALAEERLLLDQLLPGCLCVGLHPEGRAARGSLRISQWRWKFLVQIQALLDRWLHWQVRGSKAPFSKVNAPVFRTIILLRLLSER